MGNISNSNENQNGKKENNNKKEDSSKNIQYPLRTISNKYPLNEQNPIFLSHNIFFNKSNLLGRKHKRIEIDEKKEDKFDISINKDSINIEKNDILSTKENEIKNGSDNEKENEIEGKILKKCDNLINMKIEENIRENERNIKINQEDINNCLKDLKNENDEKYLKLSKRYEEIVKENNNFYEKMKNLINESSNQVNEENKKKEIINRNNKNLITKNNFFYSFQCLTSNLNIKGIQGIEELSIQINIKNNGNNDWPQENTFLICDKKKSDIYAEDVQLFPLKSKMASTVNIIICYIKDIPPGKYNVFINFNVNGKNYGREIKIEVEILKKEKKNEDEDKIYTLINKMRKEFNIPESEKGNNILKEAIIKSEYNISKAFEILFNDH